MLLLGVIGFNGDPITYLNRDAYRQHFAAVFTNPILGKVSRAKENILPRGRSGPNPLGVGAVRNTIRAHQAQRRAGSRTASQDDDLGHDRERAALGAARGDSLERTRSAGRQCGSAGYGSREDVGARRGDHESHGRASCQRHTSLDFHGGKSPNDSGPKHRIFPGKCDTFC
jgi:hypothetical protein